MVPAKKLVWTESIAPCTGMGAWWTGSIARWIGFGALHLGSIASCTGMVAGWTGSIAFGVGLMHAILAPMRRALDCFRAGLVPLHVGLDSMRVRSVQVCGILVPLRRALECLHGGLVPIARWVGFNACLHAFSASCLGMLTCWTGSIALGLGRMHAILVTMRPALVCLRD